MKAGRYDITLIAKIIVSAFFLLFLLNRLANLDSVYLKFSVIEFIYEHRLNFLFWILGFIEAALTCGLFFMKFKAVRIAVDILMCGYFIFFIPYYLQLLSLSGECIDCRYRVSLIGEDIKISFALLIFILIIYAFFIRGSPKLDF
jgi:hypothetical protein